MHQKIQSAFNLLTSRLEQIKETNAYDQDIVERLDEALAQENHEAIDQAVAHYIRGFLYTYRRKFEKAIACFKVLPDDFDIGDPSVCLEGRMLPVIDNSEFIHELLLNIKDSSLVKTIIKQCLLRPHMNVDTIDQLLRKDESIKSLFKPKVIYERFSCTIKIEKRWIKEVTWESINATAKYDALLKHYPKTITLEYAGSRWIDWAIKKLGSTSFLALTDLLNTNDSAPFLLNKNLHPKFSNLSYFIHTNGIGGIKSDLIEKLELDENYQKLSTIDKINLYFEYQDDNKLTSKIKSELLMPDKNIYELMHNPWKTLFEKILHDQSYDLKSFFNESNGSESKNLRKYLIKDVEKAVKDLKLDEDYVKKVTTASLICMHPSSLHLRILLELVDDPAEILTIKETDESTPFYNAAQIQPSNFHLILDALGERADELIKAKDNDGRTVLHRAHVDILPLLLRRLGPEAAELIKLQDSDGWTALYYASNIQPENLPLLLKTLGKQAAEVIKLQDSDGWTALHFAWKYAPVHVPLLLEALGEQAAEVIKLPTNKGWTALHFACEDGSEHVPLLLEALGEQAAEVIKLPTNKGWTALHFACEDAPEHVPLLVKALGEQATDVIKLTTNEGKTALYLACKTAPEHVPLLVETLGDQAADVIKLPTNNGKTALYLACKNQSEHVPLLVETLGEQAADVIKLQDSEGMTALHVACDSHPDCLPILFQALQQDSASELYDKPTNEGKTALSLLLKNHGNEVIEKVFLSQSLSFWCILRPFLENDQMKNQFDKILQAIFIEKIMDERTPLEPYTRNFFDMHRDAIRETLFNQYGDEKTLFKSCLTVGTPLNELFGTERQKISSHIQDLKSRLLCKDQPLTYDLIIKLSGLNQNYNPSKQLGLFKVNRNPFMSELQVLVRPASEKKATNEELTANHVITLQCLIADYYRQSGKLQQHETQACDNFIRYIYLTSTLKPKERILRSDDNDNDIDPAQMKRQLSAMTDAIKRDRTVSEEDKASTLEVLAAFDFLLGLKPSDIKSQDGGNLFYTPNNIPIHLEDYRTQKDAWNCLMVLIKTVMNIYDYASGSQQLNRFYNLLHGGFCLEGRTNALLNWGSEQNSDKEPPDFKDLMGRCIGQYKAYCEVMGKSEDIYNTQKATDFIMERHRNKPCKSETIENVTYAPQNRFDRLSVKRYLVNVLSFDDRNKLTSFLKNAFSPGP